MWPIGTKPDVLPEDDEDPPPGTGWLVMVVTDASLEVTDARLSSHGKNTGDRT